MKENDFINMIRSRFCINGQKNSIYGVGDDCAFFSSRMIQVVTCDMLAENTHFDLKYISPVELGRKSALVNLSDIIAMGAKPKYAFVSVGYNKQSENFLFDLYKGLYETFSQYETVILGGDTVKSEILVINVTLIGECEKPIMRNGAKVGDAVIISDYAGLSHAGLDGILKYGPDKYRKLTEAHYYPNVSLELGLELAKSGKVHAMMDLSDGICKDLNTLCEQSCVGAEIFTENFEISPYLQEFFNNENVIKEKYLLENYEDYSLLFTCNINDAEELIGTASKYGHPSLIGYITDSKKIKVFKNNKEYLMPKGWEHF